MTSFKELIECLAREQVEFIVIGGFAATVHGAARSTQDLDIVYRRSTENFTKLVRALDPLTPYPRGAPPGLPFRWDQRTLQLGTNFTLTTRAGWIDLLGNITGGGGYEELIAFTISVSVFGVDCHCLDLPKLVAVKRAAGRPKDFEALAELELLIDERTKGPIKSDS